MFHSDTSDDDDTAPSWLSSQLATKKRKLNTQFKPELVHSSLGHTSFRAPPIVEYSSIDSYCNKNLGKSLLPSHSSDSQSLPDLSKVRCISSPIILKSPNVCSANRTLTNSNFVPPYSFFSVEELSLVKCLRHWSSTKVCPIGQVEFDAVSQHCYLHSVLEKGSWQVLLDTSMLKEIPKLKTVLQIFGCIEVVEKQPLLKVHFYRNLGSTDVNLFVNSYRMMQKHIPDFLNVLKSNDPYELKSPQAVNPGVSCELNDTLDDYNLSIIEKCIDSDSGNASVLKN